MFSMRTRRDKRRVHAGKRSKRLYWSRPVEEEIVSEVDETFSSSGKVKRRTVRVCRRASDKRVDHSQFSNIGMIISLLTVLIALLQLLVAILR